MKIRWLHSLLLLMWVAIGAGLRFTDLTSKTPSTIELATLIFSLGNSVRSVPVDRAITLDTLLIPLQSAPLSGIREVIHYLMTESTHPPIYFVLTHLWLKLFSPDTGVVLLWAGRALSALFGVASIPAIFGLGWLAFRSRLVGQIAAAMMAVSPYGIYLAQEARHYTLTILFVIASLCCLVIAIRTIENRKNLPVSVAFLWIIAHSLGIAVHYFFSLAIAGEGLVLLGFWIKDFSLLYKDLGLRKDTFLSLCLSKHWRRIYAVATGTLIGGLVWVPVLQGVSDNELTEWIYNGTSFSDLFAPIARLLAWWISMLSLLPVEGQSLPIIVASSSILVIFIGWALPIFIRGISVQIKQPATCLSTQVLGGFILSAIALILGVTYGLGADLTLAARYHFVYFPAITVFLAAALAICWENSSPEKKGNKKQESGRSDFLLGRGKQAVAVILLMGFIGGVTVVSNLGFQKSKRADLLVPIIHQKSQAPVLIAMVHKTHAETRAMMGLGWEFKRSTGSFSPTFSGTSPQFLLAHKDNNSKPATTALNRTLSQLPRPLDLWAVNFTAPIDAEAQNCVADSNSKTKVTGYKYRLYHCK